MKGSGLFSGPEMKTGFKIQRGHIYKINVNNPVRSMDFWEKSFGTTVFKRRKL
jgi:hypothetical protein